jgi:hypothetical protein
MTSLALPSLPAAVRPGGAAAVAAALARRPDLWAPLVEYRERSRWTSLLDPGAAAAVLDPALHDQLTGLQVWLLSWLPGQGTGLHDHGESAGAFAVARGTLTERVVTGRPDSGARETRQDLVADRVRSFGTHYVHQVLNTQAEAAVSVHVYAPALRWMTSYDVVDGRLVRTGREQAGVDW